MVTEKSFKERHYSAFLSYAHADKVFADRIFDLLTHYAGIPIWYDTTSLQTNKSIATELPNCISQCRAAIVVLSQASINSGWVKEEYNYAISQRVRYPSFKIIPIRIDDCVIPGFLETTKWIDLYKGQLTLNSFFDLLCSFYSYDVSLDLQNMKDIYISRSWRESEDLFPTNICRTLVNAGFRLVGDSEDQLGFEEGDRVSSIMSSCGAFVAIVPHRGDHSTSHYILKEIELARNNGLNGTVIADPAVDLPDLTGLKLVRMSPDRIQDNPPELNTIVEELSEVWRKPQHSHYTFISTDLDRSTLVRNRTIRQLAQCITGMPCMMGEDLIGDHLQKQIRERIAGSLVMISDISGDNLNTCIEAGIAKGANTRLHLVAKEPRKRPPFMFRDLQVFYYMDDLELLAVVHKILYQYRRRIINQELS
jgi:hypothetical protein